MLCYMFFFFFFSSRRRHTRYIGDWSSDVCSSDLVNQLAQVGTMILTIAPYPLHGAVMLLRVRSGQLDRRGVLMELAQIHRIGPDRGQHHTLARSDSNRRSSARAKTSSPYFPP